MIESKSNGNLTKIAVGLSVLLLGSYMTATTTVLFTQSSKAAAIDVRLNAVENSLGSRIQSLESGRTTPMAAETRAEFNAIWREIGKTREPK